MPELPFRDCKYKRKNLFRQNFPEKIPDSAAKGTLRATRPSNAAAHGGRNAAKPDTATASGPAIFRPETPRPKHRDQNTATETPRPKRPNNPVPGRRNHSADRPGVPASLPGSFRAISGQHARPLTTGRRGPPPCSKRRFQRMPSDRNTPSFRPSGPDSRKTGPSAPPVRPSAREQNPTENADLPARPKGPFRTDSAPTPNAPRKTDTPGRRAGGVANLSGNRASRRNRDRISGP